MSTGTNNNAEVMVIDGNPSDTDDNGGLDESIERLDDSVDITGVGDDEGKTDDARTSTKKKKKSGRSPFRRNRSKNKGMCVGYACFGWRNVIIYNVYSINIILFFCGNIITHNTRHCVALMYLYSGGGAERKMDDDDADSLDDIAEDGGSSGMIRDPNRDGETTVIMEGKMHKRGQRFGKWIERWFVLDSAGRMFSCKRNKSTGIYYRILNLLFNSLLL